MDENKERMRIDKWLWAARFFKTRTLAAQEVGLHRVQVGGVDVKPARDIKVGDSLRIQRGAVVQQITVRVLSSRRGPAREAQMLYEESAESILARERAASERRRAPEPANSISHGRPTKRDRRVLDRERKGEWDQRWSASLES